MGFQEILDALSRHKRAALIACLSVITLSLAIQNLATERYEAEAVLLIGQGLNAKASDTSDPRGVINSLASIVLTDDVISKAVSKVGFDRLFPEEKRVSETADEKLRNTYLAVSQLKPAISAKVEEKSYLLRVSFRHAKPAVAADFVNALTEILSGQVDMVSRNGALGFFEGQRKRLESEVQRASDELAQFVTDTDLLRAKSA